MRRARPEDPVATKAKTSMSAAPVDEVAASADCGDSGEMMSPEKRDEALKRLARAAGQVAGISRMIGDGRHCTEVLQQIAAVHKALDAVGNIVLRNYLESCVTVAIEGGDPLIYDELMTVLARYR